MKFRLLAVVGLLALAASVLLLRTAGTPPKADALRLATKLPTTTTTTSSAWTSEPPIPPNPNPGGGATGNTEAPCAALIGGNIYVAFGFDPGSGDTNGLRIFNIASQTWTIGPSAPTTGRSEMFRGVAHGDKLFCVGGRSTPETWIFDTATNTWSPGAPEPDVLPRAGTSAATYGDNIFMFGGRHSTSGPCSGPAVTSSDRGGEILRYDIAANQWFPAGNMLNARSDTTVARVGGKIYIFGGCNGTNYPPDVEVYDPRTETSTTLAATMPGGSRSNAAASDPQNGSSANASHLIHVTGGFRTGGTIYPNNHVIFNIDTQTFTVGQPMPTHCATSTDRATQETVFGGDSIYAVGGSCPAFGAAINNVDAETLSSEGDPAVQSASITASSCNPFIAFPLCALEPVGNSLVFVTGSGFLPASQITLTSSQQGALPAALSDVQGQFTTTYMDTLCNGQNDTITASDGVNSATVTLNCS